ncbi:MAG TPA: hypothetical protein P5514_01330 [Bacteroidales bacterium]|nr:hypothetical protein [Bacteroidales bacterium]HRX95558.1 hypothetical protein [Bacteroidales bacterium]
MYRTQSFKIIVTNQNRLKWINLIFKILLVIFLITFVAAFIIYLFDISNINDLWMLFGFLLFFPFLFKTYKTVGIIKLTNETIEVFEFSTKKVFDLKNLNEVRIEFRGHLGYFSTRSYIGGLDFSDIKDGTRNFLSIQCGMDKFTYEFLSRNSTDIAYLREYEKFCKESGYHFTLISEVD